MIRIRSEIVAISKTNITDSVNSDNLNLNGKVIAPDVIDKGYKGAGNFNGDIVIGVAHGEKDLRTATTAMNALEDVRAQLAASKDDYVRIFDSYFDKLTKDISLSGGSPEQLDATVMYVFENKFIVANVGNALVFNYKNGELVAVEPDSQAEMPFSMLPIKKKLLKKTVNLYSYQIIS